ncbi:alpha/beta hydrolase [Kribbella sandramycini]|uniref:Acetyl esterase/lipase n=1 Tax=Kribbella sandramycini TaxID=60450 RepID=A0A7Y4L4W6_9ACTN|nr:alpha/beta hydrolase [Kribbella sandramycini]MBB6571351.1 acetyl esterase/lipase [Kribbella sandramycini]NOL43246.1 alpha/beta hydrolase [Kribbella sandramycini]
MTENEAVLSRAAREPDEQLRYGDDADQVIDYYQAKNPRPLVIYLHGGFWRPKYDRTHARPLCAALADLGWPVASVEYRRVPGEPDATTSDVQAALDTLPNLLDLQAGYVLVGHSAGGQLALWAAATLNPVRLRGVVALAPVADLLLADQLTLGAGAVQAFIGSGVRNDLDPVHLQAPIASVTLLHGLTDTVVPLQLSESYYTAHPTARLTPVPAAGHYELIDPESDAFHTLTAELTRLTT